MMRVCVIALLRRVCRSVGGGIRIFEVRGAEADAPLIREDVNGLDGGKGRE